MKIITFFFKSSYLFISAIHTKTVTTQPTANETGRKIAKNTSHLSGGVVFFLLVI